MARIVTLSHNARGRDTSMNRVTYSILALSLASAALSGPTATLSAAEPHHTVVRGDAVEWGAAPPSLPAGAKAAALLGSPGKEGPFVLRLKFPAVS
jgi:hypothetical protein